MYKTFQVSYHNILLSRFLISLSNSKITIWFSHCQCFSFISQRNIKKKKRIWIPYTAQSQTKRRFCTIHSLRTGFTWRHISEKKEGFTGWKEKRHRVCHSQAPEQSVQTVHIQISGWYRNIFWVYKVLQERGIWLCYFWNYWADVTGTY